MRPAISKRPWNQRIGCTNLIVLCFPYNHCIRQPDLYHDWSLVSAGRNQESSPISSYIHQNTEYMVNGRL